MYHSSTVVTFHQNSPTSEPVRGGETLTKYEDCTRWEVQFVIPRQYPQLDLGRLRRDAVRRSADGNLVAHAKSLGGEVFGYERVHGPGNGGIRLGRFLRAKQRMVPGTGTLCPSELFCCRDEGVEHLPHAGDLQLLRQIVGWTRPDLCDWTSSFNAVSDVDR